MGESAGRESVPGMAVVKQKIGIIAIGIYLCALALILVYFFVALWPVELSSASRSPSDGGTNVPYGTSPRTEEAMSWADSQSAVDEATTDEETPQKPEQSEEHKLWSDDVRIFRLDFKVSSEVRVILLVIIAGALGSLVHVVTSFVDYVGNRSFVRSWTWWYFLRPISGSILALIFYLIVRGGLLSTAIEGTDLSRFAVTGLAGLVGLFSKQAIDKLGEIFDTVFLRKAKVDREDMLKPLADQGSEKDDATGGEGGQA